MLRLTPYLRKLFKVALICLENFLTCLTQDSNLTKHCGITCACCSTQNLRSNDSLVFTLLAYTIVGFTFRTRNHNGKSPPYTLETRVDGCQNRSATFGGERNILLRREWEDDFCHVVSSLVIISNILYMYCGKYYHISDTENTCGVFTYSSTYILKLSIRDCTLRTHTSDTCYKTNHSSVRQLYIYKSVTFIQEVVFDGIIYCYCSTER